MIIALHAKAGAGKDAFADRLVEVHGYVKRGFAAPLYEEVAHAFRVTVPWLQDRTRKEAPRRELRLVNCIDAEFVEFMRRVGWHYNDRLSPRQVLQQWGTEYRRQQNVNYWLDQFARFCDEHPNVAATDTRFENEAQFVRAASGVIVEVVRPGLALVEGEHSSAKRLPQYLIDMTLYNMGTLADWHAQADELVEHINYAFRLDAGVPA